MSNGIELMKNQPNKHLNILTDLYRILFDGLYSVPFNLLICDRMDTEGLLNSNGGVFGALENEDLLSVLGNIIVSDSDPLLLV